MLLIVLCCAVWQFQKVSGIIKGTDTTIEERPYHVGLIINTYQCGGAILTQKFLITAAHCVTENVSGKIWVGSTYLEDGEMYDLANIFIHPLYVAHGTDYGEFDAGLIELEKELTYSASAQPIQLPVTGQNFSAGSLCHVSGWGMIQPDMYALFPVLRTVNVSMVDRDECARAHAGFAVVDESMICSESTRPDTVSGPCLGDSGGALVCSSVLAGIISWGGNVVTCNLLDKPYVYVNVANPNILQWIEATISQPNAGGGTKFTA